MVPASEDGARSMHADQIHVDVDTVRRLVEAQFPQWRMLPVIELRTPGTVNAIFRLGEDLTARFPLVGQGPTQTRTALAAEAAASRELAQSVSVPTTEPVAIGDPGVGYAAMRCVLLDQVISTDFGQFDLGWVDNFGFDDDFDRFYADQANGLVGAADVGGVHVNLARRSGGSLVQIELCDRAPDPPEDPWEDVVEESVSIPDGAHPRWSTWAGEDSGPLPIPAGAYRLRASAHVRDAGKAGELAEGVVDSTCCSSGRRR